MGVNQHHDAATGTAQQHVSNDYARRLTSALFQTSKLNAQILKQQLQKDTIKKITINDIDVCLINNGTYLDCPALANNSNKDFLLSTYNPTQTAINNIKFKVPPHGHYTATTWNDATASFQQTAAVVICAPRLIANGSTVDDCDIHINAVFAPDHITLIRVQYDATVNIRLAPVPQTAPQAISNEKEVWTFVNTDYITGPHFTIDRDG